MFREYGYDDFGHGSWHGHRARRGDIVPLILSVLKEKPMHGYEIIQRLEEKSHGMWRPSAGSVYPTLQMLEEQDLVTSKEQDGKRIYSITKEGEKAADEAEADRKEDWEKKAAYAMHFKEMRGSFRGIMHSFKKIASQKSEKKIEEVKKILDELDKKLAKLADE